MSHFTSVLTSVDIVVDVVGFASPGSSSKLVMVCVFLWKCC